MSFLGKMGSLILKTWDFDTEFLPVDDIILRGSISSDESLGVFLAVLSKVADVKFKMKTDGKIEVQKIN